MIYLGYELKARFDSGLILAGQNEDGELGLLGSQLQFENARALEAQYAENGYEKLPF